MKLDKLFSYLQTVSWGRIEIQTPGGKFYNFGDNNDGPDVGLVIHDPTFLRGLITNPSIALGEAYVAGEWDITKGRLSDLLGILWRHPDNRPEPGPVRWARGMLLRLLFRSNTPGVSRKAVRHHYDRGDELFRLFLDPTMAYSCGYALGSSDSLEEMQQQKYKLISQKLGLYEGASVVDLGCGWGGLLMHIARNFSNVEGVGVTVSRNQFEHLTEQIKAEGFEGRVRAELCDYRQAPGKQYDFLVSVGMFEHLARANYSAFMKKAGELLKPGGRGLLHTMGIIDDVSEPPDRWISKYIFPRHRLPRLDELINEMRRSGLHVGHVENLKPHYAETFRRWNDNLRANKSAVLQTGRDEQFYRMWDYYMNVCEAGFRYGTMDLYQILFSNQQWAFPERFDFCLHCAEPKLQHAKAQSASRSPQTAHL